jgi:hypothetical protein
VDLVGGIATPKDIGVLAERKAIRLSRVLCVAAELRPLHVEGRSHSICRAAAARHGDSRGAERQREAEEKAQGARHDGEIRRRLTPVTSSSRSSYEESNGGCGIGRGRGVALLSMQTDTVGHAKKEEEEEEIIQQQTKLKQSCNNVIQ